MSDDWLDTVAGITPGSTEVPVAPSPDASSLATLVEAAVAAESSAAAQKAVSSWLAATDRHPAVAAALLADEGNVRSLLVQLRTVRGLKQEATHVSSLLGRLAESLRAERHAAALDDLAAGASDLPEILGRDNLPPGLRCPSRWSIGRDHLRLVPDRSGKSLVVANRPILITACLRNVAGGTTSLRLEWPTARGWAHRVVARENVMDARKIIELSAWDAPVTSNNASNIVRYLSEFEDANRDVLPEARVSSAMGWQDGTTDAFLWGHALIRRGVPERSTAVEDLESIQFGDGDVYLLKDPGTTELADALRRDGTWDGWLQVAELARPYPRVWIALYAALVPPLMPFLKTLPNFIVDLAGETSKGKTTTLRFAGSVWGCPDERVNSVVRTWDSTRVWIERAAGVLRNLPLILDDTKRAKKPEDVAQTLYDVTSGSGRGRGSVSGIRDTARWRTVLLSTGEASATSFTQAGGTRARTLGFWGSPFGTADDNTVVAVAGINTGVLKHHGHLGPRLVQWLVDEPTAPSFVRERYADAEARWTGRAKSNPVAARAAQYLASLDVVAAIVHEVLGVARPEGQALEEAWSAVCEASVEADRAAEALREVLSWATGQQARFWMHPDATGSGREAPSGGWLGAWKGGEDWDQLSILPHEIRTFLTRQGYDTVAILRTWASRGWLFGESSGRHTRKVTIDGRKPRCFMLTRAACNAVSEGDQANADGPEDAEGGA